MTSVPSPTPSHRSRWPVRCVAALAALAVAVAAPPDPAGADPVPEPAVARVVTAHDAGATASFQPVPAVVDRLVARGLQAVAGAPDPAAAWARFVGPSDVVGFKVCSAPGPMSGTRPAVVEALVRSLLAAGHPAERIVIWDKRTTDLTLAGFPDLARRLGVRWASAEGAGWDPDFAYESPVIGRVVYGDLEFDRPEVPGRGRKSHVTRLLTRDITRLVSVAPNLNHNLMGVHGHLASLALGSVDNTLRFENNAGRLAEAVPEICSLPEIQDRLVLCVTDALICQYRGEDRTLLHYARTLNELRFSRDPVALDVLALADVESGRRSNPTDGEKPVPTDVYLNASLIDLGVADASRIRRESAP